MMRAVLASILILSCVTHARADTLIGKVDTTFRLLGSNDSIEVTRYDDPKVPNVSCYVSRAISGGITGSLGLATDPSRFSIACRATGVVVMPQGIERNEIIFNEKASAIFKQINVRRMVDREKEVLVYLVYSTELLNGSPFNSVTAVPTGTPQ